MVILTLTMSLLFSSQDSTKIVEYYMNGKVKVEGIRINKFKHGDWKHYNERGMIIKTEKWHYGRKTKTFAIRQMTEQVSNE
tara:strand:- start:216 stop:458 length:243 start_codon:yes stop_codon:yes gene_type:complete